MSRVKHMVSATLAVVFTLLFMGCSKANDQAPKINAQGQHPANWVQQHWVEFTRNPEQCRTCHGTAADPLAAGGISGVSCASCHPNGIKHPAGWDAAAQHGRLGAMVRPGIATGFANCAVCHGASYTNAQTRSCYACHSKAPHPDKPWHGTTASGTNHAKTDPANVLECAKCHLGAANSTFTPATPPPAGAAPGCYNNTMCHGNNPNHVVGWKAPAAHGKQGAMAAPTAASGFATCATCHGSSYTNGIATSCQTCHTKAPHPDKPWWGTTSSKTNHNVTHPANAPECFKCHAAGANSSLRPATPPPAGAAPGCLNNTMCHGTSFN